MYNYAVSLPEITDHEQYLIQQKLYKQDILSIFFLDEFDETQLNESIYQLYEHLNHTDKLKSVCLKAASLVMSMNEEMGFLVLFSFDYLYATHACICDMLKSGIISDKNMTRLEELVQ